MFRVYTISKIYGDTRTKYLLLSTHIGQFFALFVNYLKSVMFEFRFVSESVFIVMKLNLLCTLTLSRMSRSFDVVGGRCVRITCHINDLDYAGWCEPAAWQAMVWHFVSPDMFFSFSQKYFSLVRIIFLLKSYSFSVVYYIRKCGKTRYLCILIIR